MGSPPSRKAQTKKDDGTKIALCRWCNKRIYWLSDWEVPDWYTDPKNHKGDLCMAPGATTIYHPSSPPKQRPWPKQRLMPALVRFDHQPLREAELADSLIEVLGTLNEIAS